ncbi:MAG: Zn-ribbon domain-containing OB-fold protein [Acidimicrobiales bacterium]|jgi:uncharacterized OB-fold protein|tara:strand:+ start:7361 stop:7789 length:429 start_codon:yes stop_codon:yes gene_type:complete
MSDPQQKSYKKYIPNPEGLNLELHLKAVETGLLHIQRCLSCDKARQPPRYYCSACFSSEYEFVPVSGEGFMYSFAINHFTVDRAWIEEVPYVTAVVQLVEGPRVVGALRNAEPQDVNLGDPVLVSVEPRGEEFAFIWVDKVQ